MAENITLSYLQQTYPGIQVPYKQRPANAADKSTIQVYQPSTTNYQQIMHVQQPFVPVSCEYRHHVPPIHIPLYLPENCH